ncbi:hypothetical protein SAMN02910418_00965 [Bowdeniella nasicola]|uniref:Uncharacterized protein n=1 Tax=Bowdeniella nasicola TaxID=208480 RepID=A0A1H3YQH3_9ACTO|nr:hypothetical protein [Bowdeniella nasicola]SEA13806.1 hypothetical protein SAMN02910418_00965 [Bowdeniella nasicola]
MIYRVGVSALLAVLLVCGAAPGVSAAGWIDPDEEPNRSIAAWVADSAREWIALDDTRSADLDPAALSFGTPVRALTWHPRVLGAGEESEPLWPDEDAGPGRLVPPSRENEPERRPSPPRHPGALPAGSDPVTEGLVQAVDVWWVPVLLDGAGVGVLEVAFERATTTVAATWSAPAAQRIIGAPHTIVRDDYGFIGINLPNVVALDAAARDHVAGEVPIETYLDSLTASMKGPAAEAARTGGARAPIIATILTLLILGALMWLFAWQRDQDEEDQTP